MTATLEPGLRGPEAEALLAAEGLTLGHYPQSFEYATIGGFAATRSSGQSSAGYGRFDALVVGLRVATPRGEVALGSAPANAAGPDLRQLFLGSEGAFGVITAVTVRVRRLPGREGLRGLALAVVRRPARDAMRTLAQAGLLPTVIRLSDESETAINLARPDEIGGESESAGGCLMIAGYEGEPEAVAAKRAAVTAVLSGLGGDAARRGAGRVLGARPVRRAVPPRLAARRRRPRRDPGDRDVLVQRATALYAGVKAALERTARRGDAGALPHLARLRDRLLALLHGRARRRRPTRSPQWLAAKAAASDAIVAAGATITHHHAVGTDHKPWLVHEIGELGVSVLRAVKADLDPTGVLNPGVLIP